MSKEAAMKNYIIPAIPIDPEAERIVDEYIRAARPEPPPKPGDRRILDLVLTDLTSRAEVGKAKYGTYLQSNNGRDALMDAYQEALDLCMYLRQALEERR